MTNTNNPGPWSISPLIMMSAIGGTIESLKTEEIRTGSACTIPIAMCGRYTLKTPADVYEAVFRLMLHYELRARYNIAPTQDAPIIRAHAEDNGRESALMRWGLIPSWAKDPTIGNRLINARIETAHEKPAFRSAWKHRRCLVPADGFYEWKTINKAKQPYHIRLPDDQPFAFAGLWESWTDEEGNPIESYTILTCDAGYKLRPLHDRMPVVVHPDDHDHWLSKDSSKADPETLIDHAHRFADSLEYRPVNRIVNSPKNDSPDCLSPIDA